MKYHTFPLATVASPHRVVLMSVKSSWVRYVRKPSMLLQPDSQTILCREAFSQRSLYTQKLLHRAAFTQRSFTRRRFYTEQHRGAFTQSSFSTQALCTQSSFYTQKLYIGKPSCRAAFAHRGMSRESLYTEQLYTRFRLVQSRFRLVETHSDWLRQGSDC